jgi:hypothetical protein
LIVARGAFVDGVTELYSPPFTFLDLPGEIPVSNQEEAGALIQGFANWLGGSPGWSAAVIGIQTQALNDTAMMLVAEWRIQDRSGKPITEGDTVQYFYLLSKQTGVWKVVGEGTVSAKTRIALGTDR